MFERMFNLRTIRRNHKNGDQSVDVIQEESMPCAYRVRNSTGHLVPLISVLCFLLKLQSWFIHLHLYPLIYKFCTNPNALSPPCWWGHFKTSSVPKETAMPEPLKGEQANRAPYPYAGRSVPFWFPEAGSKWFLPKKLSVFNLSLLSLERLGWCCVFLFCFLIEIELSLSQNRRISPSVYLPLCC